MGEPRIVVVGAGAGGLAAAMRLAARGHRVTVFERGSRPGGKIRSCRRSDIEIDVGPTVFTMIEVFESLFRETGRELADCVTARPLATLARHWWPDGSTLDLHADVDGSVDAIGDFAGAQEARAYRAFTEEGRRVYEQLADTFLTRDQPGLTGLFRHAGLRGLPGLLQLKPFASLWQVLGKRFQDARLRQLFGRYSTYCGSSPMSAPATLMLIAHVEQSGVWQLDGGMRALAAAMAERAAAAAADIRYDTGVDSLVTKRGRVTGVVLDDGEHVRADAIVFNGDSNALACGLLGGDVSGAASPTALAQRSLSAVTFAGPAPRPGAELDLHNVFFSSNYEREFRQLFHDRVVPDEPTVYLFAPESGAAERAPLFALVNAPANGDRLAWDARLVERARRAAVSTFERCGNALGLEGFEATTPTDFHLRFPATGGALYGPAMHGWRAAFRRPGSRTRIAGLYLAGGSAHPGSGVPMAALSGRIAAGSVLEDLDHGELHAG